MKQEAFLSKCVIFIMQYIVIKVILNFTFTCLYLMSKHNAITKTYLHCDY